MAAPCTCPNGQHDGRFPYCSGASGGPIVIERSRTNWAEIIDPRDERIAQLEAEVARLEALIVEADTIHAPMSVTVEAAAIRSKR